MQPLTKTPNKTIDFERLSDDEIDAMIAQQLGYPTKVERNELWVRLPKRSSKELIPSSDWWPSFWCWARSWDQATELYQQLPRELWGNGSPYSLSSREMCERWLHWKLSGMSGNRIRHEN